MKTLRFACLLLLPVWCALFLSSCGLFSHESVEVEHVSDSVGYAEAGKPVVSALLEVDYPSGGDPLMVRGVKQWMGGLLGLTDTTAMAGAEQFVEAFYKQNEPGKEMLKNFPAGYQYNLTVKKVDETAAYVTFLITTHTRSGAEEMTMHTGATFVKPTAKIFGYEMFVADRPRSLAVLVMNGLCKTLDAEDFNTLTRYIDASCFSPLDNGVNKLPQAAPWIEGDDVVFQYAADELRCDSIALPQARVPLAQAKEFFSPSFVRALEEANK